MATSNEGLNLVLLGRTGVGKSSSGNTILGREVFKSKRSSRSVTRDIAVESATVGHIPVTVYDTPGLFDARMCDNEINLAYQSILQKCESGHCVFLLVIKADRFTEEERRTVEVIEKLLGEKRLNKTWILFTRGDELEEENLTIQEFISETEPLSKLIQKYDHRYHVFDNRKRGYTMQVQLLLIKILKLCFDTMEVQEMLRQNPRMIKTLYLKLDVPVSNLTSRRIVLLGKTGVGKSAAGNTILGQKVFRSALRMTAVTSECSEAHTTVSGRSVSVVDTPGLFDTEMNPEEIMREIARSVYLSSPGPHVFLIVFALNMKFTEQDQQILHTVEMMFGEEVLKYSILLFTHGDLLDGESVEELTEYNGRLRRLVDQCRGRYHVLNNTALNNREQVNDLLQKIDTMIEQNGGEHYSNQMFQDSHRYRREEEEWRLQEKERKREKQRQEEIERIRKETEKRIRAEMEVHYKYELERQREEEERRQQEEESFFTRFKHHCLVAGAAVGAAAGLVAAAPLVGVAAPVAAVAGAVGVGGVVAASSLVAVAAPVAAVAGAVGVGVGVGEVLHGVFAAQRRERKSRRENDRSFRK